MRIIFMGTPTFALPPLKALIESEHEVVAVYTAPPRPAHRGKKVHPSAVHQYADSHQLPVFTPASLKSKDSQEAFRAHQADIVVVVAYGLLLPQAILDACPKGCINIHPSSLPRWRGAAPIQRSIMAGDTDSSVCIMQMDAGLDTGAVLMEEAVYISNDMTAKTLEDKMATIAAPLLLQTLQGIEEGTTLAMPQSEDGATYAQKITKIEAAINFERPAQDVLRHIHGLSPFPGAYITHEGERIKLLQVELIETPTPVKAGDVIGTTLTIQCADHAIRPITIQRAGKQPMDATECLRGFTIPAGTNFS